jgi:hypothetical protein
MSDLRCSPLPNQLNIVGAFLQNKNQVCETPAMTKAPEAVCESPAPMSEAPQREASSPVKTPSSVAPPSEEATLQAVENNPVDFNFVEGFSSEEADFFEYASDSSEMSFNAVDMQKTTQGVHTRMSLGEVQSKGNINPFAGAFGLDTSANTLHISQTDKKRDGSSTSIDLKVLEAHAGFGSVVHEDGSKTSKIALGASLGSAEIGYDDGEGHSAKFGLSVGVGVGLSVATKDSDQDGLGEACIGAEAGPISFELCGENTPKQQAWEDKLNQTEDFGDRLMMLGELPTLMFDGIF